MDKARNALILLDFAKYLNFSGVPKNSDDVNIMFRSDFWKKGVCFKSATKALYPSKVLVSECIFKLVCHCQSCKSSEIGCA